MAIVHKAYSFNPIRFQTFVEENTVFNNYFEPLRLLELARSVMSNASPTLQQNLQNLRFDLEWLETREDTAHTYHWYLIALARELSPSISLSNTYIGSYSVLQVVLPLAGWKNSEIVKLVNGSPLHTLPDILKHDFLGIEGNALDQFGGWLSLTEIKILEEQLENSGRYFFDSSSESIDAIRKADEAVSAVNPLKPEDRMARAYNDGITMLREAIKRDEALFIHLD
jgi:hypothetical protein